MPLEMQESLRVLMLEDNANDAELVRRELQRAGYSDMSERLVETEAAFRSALADFEPHVILADFSLPTFDGMQALDIAHAHRPDTPFLFVSGTMGEEPAIDAIKRGATDYVLKHNLRRLPSALHRALAEARERTERQKMQAELEATRQQLDSVMGSLHDVVWSVAWPSEQVLYINPAVREVYGREASEFLAQPELWLRVIHADDRPRVLACWKRISNGEAYEVEYRIVRPDGTLCWVHDRAHRASGSGPDRVDGIIRDITAEMEQRQRIARLSRIRELFGSVTSAMLRASDRDALLKEATRVTVEVGRFQAAILMLLDPLTRRAFVAASHGEHPDFLDAIAVSAEPHTEAGGGIVGRSIRSGNVAFWNDIGAEANVRLRERHLAANVRAAASFPLIVENEVMGALLLHSNEPNIFDSEELRLLQDVVGNICFALDLRGKQDKLRYLTNYDALTGLPNRQLFEDRLRQFIELARGNNTRVGLVVLGLQRLHAINESLGLQAGDYILQHFARKLRELLKEDTQLARLAGDHFAICVPAVKDEARIGRALEHGLRLLSKIRFRWQDNIIHLSASAGVALFPDDAASADELLRNASTALRGAKQTGERTKFYAPEMNSRVVRRIELETQLRAALKQLEYRLHYQPKIELATGRVCGWEALLRWDNPQSGLIPPGNFIPLLEETGLIVPVGAWVLEQVLADLPALRAVAGDVPVALNVSAVQLREHGYVNNVGAVLQSARGLDPKIELEITESVFLHNLHESAAKLNALRATGVSIAIDDFGTGYSSLSYLTQLPIDTLKVDQSFVARIADDAHSRGVVSAIVALGHTLGLRVSAEGVEQEEQASVLRSLGCDEAQGYLFGKPQPLVEWRHSAQR